VWNVGRTQPGPVELTVEAAISRVLAAERTARERIVEAESRAGAIEEAGRERAQAIASRTERRMLRARDAFDDATRSALSTIAGEISPADREQPDAADRELLVDAVVALAARLAGDIA